MPGDYDGVGHTELAVFRPATAQWLIAGPNGLRIVSFGAGNLADIPVPGDYDGVGRAEIAVFRPATAQWIIENPNGSQRVVSFGAGNLADIPVPGDYDGVGHTELAVFRPATAQWLIAGPTGLRTFSFGAGNLADIPLTAPIGSLVSLGSASGIPIASAGITIPSAQSARSAGVRAALSTSTSADGVPTTMVSPPQGDSVTVLSPPDAVPQGINWHARSRGFILRKRR